MAALLWAHRNQLALTELIRKQGWLWLTAEIIFLVAFIVMFIFLILLNIIFWWLPFLKICFPIPVKPTSSPGPTP